jgi:hypothetical protein
MHSLARGLQQRWADSQIRIALVAAAVFIGLRLVVVVTIVGHGAVSAAGAFFAQLITLIVIASGLTYGLIRKHFASALALFAVWAITFGYTWWQSGRWIPPLDLTSILIGVGLFQGVRGTNVYRSLAREGTAAR